MSQNNNTPSTCDKTLAAIMLLVTIVILSVIVWKQFKSEEQECTNNLHKYNITEYHNEMGNT